jgi:16S rRNA (uracil1498-N3)-methyltransferase
MPIPRIFQAISLKVNETLTLPLDAAHYLGSVRRTREGDRIIIFNGEGGEHKAEVLAIKKEKFTVKIESYQEVSNESPLNLHLAQGVARGEKMDLIIQKAVELGVKSITPVFTERSNVKLEADKRSKRQQHWQMVAISACEQSGRVFVPQVALPLSLNEWLKTFEGKGLTLSPYAQTKISDLKLSQEIPLTLLVGPEGGLSEAEINQAEQKNFLPLSLGPRILRTETAPLAAIAALQVQFGDLG